MNKIAKALLLDRTCDTCASYDRVIIGKMVDPIHICNYHGRNTVTPAKGICNLWKKK